MMTPAMEPLYPFRFRPILRRYIWGGRRLESVLGKQLGPGDDYAESWEICDHGQDQSVVDAGPLAGWTLADLVRRRGADVLARHHPQPNFPLLFKFLDARQTLSVQVHPDDAQAALQTPPDLGKTEAWVVLAADPGSLIYAGLKRGFDRPALARELARGTCDLCLHRIEPRVGDCIFLPAGVVHAIGQGLVVAEIQQASDTTFRLFDWNRAGADGKPRPLHIEQAMAVIDFDHGPVAVSRPMPTDRDEVRRLVSCDKFILDEIDVHGGATVGGDERCHILALVGGEASVQGDPDPTPRKAGATWLVPAAVGAVQVHAHRAGTKLLDAYLP